MSEEHLSQAEVGARTAELRAERGVSQQQLARAIGLDPSALSRVESGERGLAVGELVAIAGFLGVETDRLLRREVEAAPLFRTEGAPDDRAQAALAAFDEVIEDFCTFEAAARG